MLTPTEKEKLPYCKFAWFGKCDVEKHNDKECVKCMCYLIFQSLQHEDIATAVHGLHGLMDILKVLDVLPKEAKP